MFQRFSRWGLATWLLQSSALGAATRKLVGRFTSMRVDKGQLAALVP